MTNVSVEAECSNSPDTTGVVLEVDEQELGQSTLQGTRTACHGCMKTGIGEMKEIAMRQGIPPSLMTMFVTAEKVSGNGRCWEVKACRPPIRVAQAMKEGV